MNDPANLAAPLKYYLDQVVDLQSQEELPDPSWRENSPGAADQSVSDREAVATLLVDSVLLMESAAEHGWCIHRCFEDEVLSLAAVTAARTVMECVATGLWLLDQGADSHERLRRSLIRRSENVRQQRSLANSHGDGDSVRSANERLRAIAQRAADLGIETTTADPPRIAGQLPTLTARVGEVLGMEKYYRIYSGAVHGHQTYIRFLAMESDRDDPQAISKTVRPEVVGDLVVRSVQLLYRLDRAIRAYRGLPTEDVDAILVGTKEWIGRSDIHPADLLSGLPPST